MTALKSTYRTRRRTGLSIPRNIAQWFAGERGFTFYAYTYPHRIHLKKYWAAWVSVHPEAVMPAGLKSLLESPAPPPGWQPDP